MDRLPTLTTLRLTLRPFRLADAASVQRLAGDRDVASTTRLVPHPYVDGMAEAWIDTHARAFTEGRLASYAICEGEGQLVGCVSLTLQREDDRGELGYWIGKPFWGQGYATEAAQALLNFGFVKLDLHRVFAYHLLRNPASGRVLTKLGMTAEGVLRDHIKKWGCYEDVGVYGIVRAGHV